MGQQNIIRQNPLAFKNKETPSEKPSGMLDNVWQEFLKIVNEEEGSRIVETWFKAVTFIRWDSASNSAYLQAPNKFVQQWIQSNYLSVIKAHLSRLLNTQEIEIYFYDEAKALPSKISGLDKASTEKKSKESTSVMVRPTAGLVPAKVIKNKGALNQNYIFDTFIVGPTNSFACAAAQAVAQKPGKFCNPFFIYGSSGLGKTHLLHAIGNAVKETNKRARILYQPASRFVNEFINSIKFDKVAQFEAKFKELDVLLIDDIQYISNKEQTQEAFFHIFNILYDNHKQIVFSCDTYPKDINGIEERLRTRFEWGLVADIQEPKLETKIAILRRKAESTQCDLADEVAEFIASTANNVRVLEGALIRVIAFASLTQQNITLDLAQKVLIPQERVPENLTLERVAREVGKYYQLSLADLRSSSRRKDLVQARQVAMYLMKDLCDRSLNEIGVFLRKKNHSTVLHAFDKIEEQKQDRTKTWRDIELLRKRLL